MSSAQVGGSPAPAPSAGTDKPVTAAGGDATSAPTGAPALASEKSETTKPKKKATKKKSDSAKAKKPGTTRKKKATSKASGSSASNAAVVQAAKDAKTDLAHARAHAAALRTDPLWYRIEDVLPPTTTHTVPMVGSGSSVLPEQVSIVEKALTVNNMIRSDVTPQAMACLLEQARRYAQELIEDAQDYAVHANDLYASQATPSNKGVGPLPEISAKDYQLAAEMRPDHPQAVTAQLPKLNLLSQQVNAAPLPPIPTQCYSGILLPSAPHALTSRTFDVVSGAHVAQKMIQNAPAPTKGFQNSLVPSTPDKASSKSSSKSSKTGYGASRGTQIPVNLKKSNVDNSADGPKATTSSSTGGTPPKS